MERLTKRNKDNEVYFPYCFRKDTCDGMGRRNCDTCENTARVCEKLAQYEDTGLTPEQLAELDRIHSEQAAELMKYKNLEKQIGFPLNELAESFMEYIGNQEGKYAGGVLLTSEDAKKYKEWKRIMAAITRTI